jgi:hypothetical protein
MPIGLPLTSSIRSPIARAISRNVLRSLGYSVC